MRSSAFQPLPLASIVETRLAELRSELAVIESSQRPAWDRYFQCVLRLLDDITRVNDTTLPSEMSAPQRLEQVADVARNRLTATEDMVDAGKALYTVLTPVQRAVADRRMADVAMPMFVQGHRVAQLLAAIAVGRRRRPARWRNERASRTTARKLKQPDRKPLRGSARIEPANIFQQFETMTKIRVVRKRDTACTTKIRPAFSPKFVAN